jgi:hypothetical protein
MRCIFDLFIRGKKAATLHVSQHVDKDGSHESVKDMKLRLLREISDAKSEFVTLVRRIDLENKVVDNSAKGIDKA